MAQCYRAAIDIHFIHVEPEIFSHCAGLCSKCLVCLDKVNVGNRETGFLQGLFSRGNWAETHDLGIDARGRIRDYFGHRLQPQFLCLVRGHNQDSHRAVIYYPKHCPR